MDRPHSTYDVEKWPHKKIAKVRSARLGTEDHGIWTAWLDLDYGGAGQGAGGYGLDNPKKDASGKFLGRVGTAFGMHFVMRLCEACGVDEWSKLTGRTVYALFKGDTWGTRVEGIAPLPMEAGKPFWFDECASELEATP